MRTHSPWGIRPHLLQTRGKGKEREAAVRAPTLEGSGGSSSPDALVVLAAPAGEESRAGAEAAQDARAAVLAAAATLLRPCGSKHTANPLDWCWIGLSGRQRSQKVEIIVGNVTEYN